LGKGIHALIRTNIPDPEENNESEAESEDKIIEEETETEPVAASSVPEPLGAPKEEPADAEPTATPNQEPVDIHNIIPEGLVNQLREIKELDFEEKRVATYQKALERAWFDEKITADEQFILDGLREVLEISDDEHRSIELGILEELESRYSDGIDKEMPLGNIENEHDRKKREIYDYFQRGSEMYEADKFFEAITEWEKILEIDPANPLIMKAINNARRRLDSPSIEAIGQETVYAYQNPLKEMKETEKREEQDTAEEPETEPVPEPEPVPKPAPKPVPEPVPEPEPEEVKAPEPEPIEQEPTVEHKPGTEPVPASETEEIEVPERAPADNSEWISRQKAIQSELMAIKDEDDKETKKLQRMFRSGLKQYKAGKYVKAMKIWKRVLSIDPEHEKAKKGLKLALKKYKLKKKSVEKKTVDKDRMDAKIAEMEIPELAETPAAAEKKLAKEMEIPEIELQQEPAIVEDAGAGVEGEVVDTGVASEPAAATVEPETAELTAGTEVISAEPEVEPEPVIEEIPGPVKEAGVETEDVQPIIEEIIPPERAEKEIIDEHYDRALNFARIGKFREAVEQLDVVLAAEPNNSQALNDKGFLLFSTGRLDESLECYQKAVSIDPNLTDAWVNQGVAFNKLNQRERALEAYDSALQIEPNLEEAWTNKGVVLFHLRKMDDAVFSFKKGLELNPRSEEAWLNLGYTYEKIERYSDAVAAFEEVLKLNPNNSDAHAGIAACQQNLKYELLREWNI
jgi:tetratricopeptide (TPR) repeat protein